MHLFLVSEKKGAKYWTLTEEKKLLRIWFNNLVALHSGQNKDNVYEDMVMQLQNHGINVTKNNILSKRGTLVRRYKNALHSKRAQQSWAHFEKMHAIMRYEQALKEKNSTLDQEDMPIKTFELDYVCEAAHMVFDLNATNIGDEAETTTLSDKPKRKLRRKTEIYTHTQKEKRQWDPKDNEIFLNVWLKHNRALTFEQPKTDAHKKMSLELQGHGIDLNYIDVKHKIMTFYRKYQKDTEKFGSDSDWAYYAKVKQLVTNPNATTFEDSFNNCDNISISDDSYCWFDDDMPENESMENTSISMNEHIASEDDTTAIKTSANNSKENNECVQNETDVQRMKLERSSIDIELEAPNNSMQNIENVQTSAIFEPYVKIHQMVIAKDEPAAKKSKCDETAANTSLQIDSVQTVTTSTVSSSNIIDLNDSDDCENDSLQVDQVKEPDIEKPTQDGKPKLSDEYGQFVVKELNTLSENLLIEAKRKIYNIICKLQMKQIAQSNKSK